MGRGARLLGAKEVIQMTENERGRFLYFTMSPCRCPFLPKPLPRGQLCAGGHADDADFAANSAERSPFERRWTSELHGEPRGFGLRSFHPRESVGESLEAGGSRGRCPSLSLVPQPQLKQPDLLFLSSVH